MVQQAFDEHIATQPFTDDVSQQIITEHLVCGSSWAVHQMLWKLSEIRLLPHRTSGLEGHQDRAYIIHNEKQYSV